MQSKLSHNIETSLRFLVLLMWGYALCAKLINPTETHAQLNNQVFSRTFSNALFYLIPLAECMVILLLFLARTRRWGYVGSTLLLSLFTGYIILIKLSYFGRIPCSCGGVISGFSWTQHLLFNSLFLILSMIGFLLIIKERRIDGKAP